MFEAFKKSLAESREQAEAEERARREAAELSARAEREAKEAAEADKQRSFDRLFEYVAGNSTWEYCNVLEFRDPDPNANYVDIEFVDASGVLQGRRYPQDNGEENDCLEIINKLGKGGWEAYSSSISFNLTDQPFDDRPEIKKALSVHYAYSLKRRV